ncbi:MAG: TldD/PmbA family protein [Nitrospirota bacterium]
MEQLLEMAKRVSDQAEIYSTDSRADSISFENARLKDIESSIQSGVSLRIIKNGVQGFAYTMNLIDRSGLIQNALDSLKGGVTGIFDFPLTKEVPSVDTYDPSLETVTASVIVEECQRVCELLSRLGKGQINLLAHRSINHRRILNSSGTDLAVKSSAYVLSTEILYPYTSASLHRSLLFKAFQKAPDDYLDYLSNTYAMSTKEVSPRGKEMKVLFLPETMYVLMSRLQSATNGVSIYQKISPVAEKIGGKVFDERITIYNDPLNDLLPGARSFDDEGIRCSLFPIVEKGVLKNFYYDLYFADKLNASPTGHGFRGSISSKPVPSLNHLSISPGKASFSDILRSIDRGVIVAGALGAHSGNIPLGDFSIGVSPALYVESGEIIGNIKDVMVAGNIYDTLKTVIEIENYFHPCFGGKFPAILFDNVNVTVRK